MATTKRNYKRPAKKVRIVAKRPGKLGGKGYLTRTATTRHRLLSRCVSKYGYHSCLGSIQAMSEWGKNTFTMAQKQKLVQDRLWLRKEYGGPGSFGPRKNPSTDSAIKIVRSLNSSSRRTPDEPKRNAPKKRRKTAKKKTKKTTRKRTAKRRAR